MERGEAAKSRRPRSAQVTENDA